MTAPRFNGYFQLSTPAPTPTHPEPVVDLEANVAARWRG